MSDYKKQVPQPRFSYAYGSTTAPMLLCLWYYHSPYAPMPILLLQPLCSYVYGPMHKSYAYGPMLLCLGSYVYAAVQRVFCICPMSMLQSSSALLLCRGPYNHPPWYHDPCCPMCIILCSPYSPTHIVLPSS
eukprot:3265895-Rhodomonas_salina.1